MAEGIKYTEQQLKAVLHKEGPALVLAVPGAGKTTVLLSRTANLIKNNGVNPQSILSITFSRAAANDMKNRFYKLFGKGIQDGVNFSTIHSFAYSIVRNYYKKINSPLNIIEGQDVKISKYHILRSIYKAVNREFASEDKLDIVINIIGYAKNMMLSKEEIIEYGKKQKIDNIYNVYSEYEEFKRDNNYLDFDDMLYLCYEILKTNTMILNYCRNRFKYIQLDEGQDTSKLQYEIIKLLAYPYNNIFVVADDDQSIYGFRGAYPDFLLNYKSTFKNAQIFYMEQNFRSTDNIVSVSNGFIKSNTKRYRKNMFTDRNAGEKVKVYNVRNSQKELDLLLAKIKKTGCLNDIAVLYRNNLSVIPIVDLLDKNNINFYVKDYNNSFFKHWVVVDISACMTLAIDNSDVDAFERIYYKISSYVNKKQIQKMRDNIGDGVSVFDYLIKHGKLENHQWRRIEILKSEFSKLAKLKPYEAIRFIKVNLGYIDYLFNNASSMGYSFENLESVTTVLESISKGTDDFDSFFDRLNQIKDIMNYAKNNKDNNAVTLSTVHSSKGLEFNKVIIVSLLEGSFPTSISITDARNGELELIEEERRLMYVGMTRAKEELNLIVPVFLNGSNEESRFIHEVRCCGNGSVESLKYEESDKIKGTVKNMLDINLCEGDSIVHKSFGRGLVDKISNGIMWVKFSEFGVKQLAVEPCIENKLICKE